MAVLDPERSEQPEKKSGAELILDRISISVMREIFDLIEKCGAGSPPS